jgi:hypothetical protein
MQVTVYIGVPLAYDVDYICVDQTMDSSKCVICNNCDVVNLVDLILHVDERAAQAQIGKGVPFDQDKRIPRPLHTNQMSQLHVLLKSITIDVLRDLLVVIVQAHFRTVEPYAIYTYVRKLLRGVSEYVFFNMNER